MSTQPATRTNAFRTDHAHPIAAAASLAVASEAPIRDGSRAAANADTVKAIFAAFATGDVPAILSKLSEDVEWEFGNSDNKDIPWLRAGRGRDHVARFFQTMAGFSIDRFDVLDVLANETWGVGLVSLDFTWTATGGRIVEACEAVIWRFDEAGLISAVRHAVDTRQHARALRLT
jgi:ketosteroid isomerase-like protein